MPGRREPGARLYAALLRLYPERLRRERGEEMLALYRAQAADAARRGMAGRVAFTARVARDLVRSVPAEHGYARRLRRGAARSYRRRGSGMSSMVQDIRFAVRSFARAPAFTVAALATLGIGLGATTTMFGVVDGILLRPLPYGGGGALVQIGLRAGEFTSSSTSPSDYRDLAERSRTLEAVAVSRLQWMDLSGGGEPERVDAAGVSHTFFEVLGAAPALGRTFTPVDDTRAGEAVVVLSDGFWRRRFGAGRDVIGRTLLLNEAPYTVVGVMPAGFRGPEAIYQGAVELWFPMGRLNDSIDVRGDAFMQMIARARPGTDLEDVRAELSAIGARLGEEYPAVGVREFWVADLRDRTVGDSRRMLWLLLGAVGLLLAIACANVANLSLVRATERTRELAVRTALGAGRARLARQMITESVLLALGGGLVGALLARAGVAAFRALAPAGIPRIDEIVVDPRVLGFAFATALATGLVFGLAPAVAENRASVAARLRAGGGAGGTRRGHRVRGAFVVAQIAIALVLLTGAGLLGSALLRLSAIDPGFAPEGLAWLRVQPPSRRYPTAAARHEFFSAAIERIRALPGVQSASGINGLPLEPNRDVSPIVAEGAGDLDGLPTSMHAVLPGYFATLGIPLLQGRPIVEADGPGAEPVAVVNRTLARAFWPDGGAVGRRFRFAGDGDAPWITVVGVADDVRHYALAEPAPPMLYRPIAQYPRTWLSIVVRHDGAAAPLLRSMRDAAWSIDPALPLDESGTAEGLLAASLVQERFRAVILATFAAVALVLTVVGLYGALAHLVRARTREMGIRLALGAAAADVRRDIVWHGLATALLGLALGLPAAFLAARLLAGFVFGVSTADPVTFAAVAISILAVALVAAWVPARRAAALDPAHTLRAD